MKQNRWKRLVSLSVVVLFTWGLMMPMPASADPVGTLVSLKTAVVPLPPNLNEFVINTQAAIQLGKAFFWDMQTGSDGKVACATCHFQAGADIRATNTVHPGVNNIFNTVFPGGTLTAANFPISKNDIVGSQGVLKMDFLALSGSAKEHGIAVFDPVFNAGGKNRRQVTGRNAPSVINAIFNFRSFWDGRASNIFNGVNPSGNPATVLQVNNGVVTETSIRLENASLASQATGPPLNDVEMSWSGKSFPELGRKLLRLQPLAQQLVHPADSSLGVLSASPANGLNTNYKAMIKAAFAPRWWQGGAFRDANGFKVIERNFSMFWGISLMLYQSTLVSDNSPVDRFLLPGGSPENLTPQQIVGLNVFTGEGRCDKCHMGAEMTNATVFNVAAEGGDELEGFDNIGVRPAHNDGGDVLQPGLGRFKTPGLRNVELNGPYFHNGGMATLHQVVQFYNRGGDFQDDISDSDIRPLGMDQATVNFVVNFLVGLTDNRVRRAKAPFDHPSLVIPNGPSLPAVGAGGRGANPMIPFLGLPPTRP